MGRAWAGVCLMLVAAACGGAEMSLTEYAGELNAIVERAAARYEKLVATAEGRVLIAGPDQLADFAPADLQTALEEVREIEAEVDAATGAINPPQRVAELHRLFFDFDDEFIIAQETLAARAGTAATWVELSETPEMAAYRTALAADQRHCTEVQAEVNAIGEQRETLAEIPWMPGELKEVFAVVLACDGYPDHPEDLYRPLSTGGS